MARFLVFMATAGVIAVFGVIDVNPILTIGATAVGPNALPVGAAFVGIVARRWWLTGGGPGTGASAAPGTVVYRTAATRGLRLSLLWREALAVSEQRSAGMAKDLTDVLRDQLQQAVREFAENLSNGSEKQRPSRRFSGMKGAVVGAGVALAAKKGIDAVRQNPGLLDGVSNRISAKLEELQGREEEPEEVEEGPDDEVEEEPELEAEGGSDEEPPADAEEDPAAEGETEPESEAEESEPEAKPRTASKRKPRSTPSRRAAKPKAGTRAKKPASTSTRRRSNGS